MGKRFKVVGQFSPRGDDCPICGREFRSDDCPHSVVQVESALQQREVARLVRLALKERARRSSSQH
jgi:hypothetical protein